MGVPCVSAPVSGGLSSARICTRVVLADVAPAPQDRVPAKGRLPGPSVARDSAGPLHRGPQPDRQRHRLSSGTGRRVRSRTPGDRQTQRVLSPEEAHGVRAARLSRFRRRECRRIVQRRTPVVQIGLRRGDESIDRVFNAYTGEDLGDPFPWTSRALLWLVTLHDDLLMPADQRGRFWNGIGSILTTILCLTGAVVWWPGIRHWRRGSRSSGAHGGRG